MTMCPASDQHTDNDQHCIAWEVLQRSLARRNGPFLWASDVIASLQVQETPAGSAPLAAVLIARLCKAPTFDALSWSYLEHALAAGLAPKLYVLATLTKRVPSLRQSKPPLFTAFLKLAASLSEAICPDPAPKPSHKRALSGVMKHPPVAVEAGMSVSSTSSELEVSFVVLQLVTALVAAAAQDLRVGRGGVGGVDYNGLEDATRSKNTVASLAVATKLLLQPKTAALLQLARLAHANEQYESLRRMEELTDLAEDKSALSKEELAAVVALTAAWDKLRSQRKRRMPLLHLLRPSAEGVRHGGAVSSVVWLPLELALEEAMEGKRLPDHSTAHCLLAVLQIVRTAEGVPWGDLFLALWITGLRSLHRNLRSLEGRTSLLLCHIPQALSHLLQEVACKAATMEAGSEEVCADTVESIRDGLASSIRLLGDLTGLLAVPEGLITAPNETVDAVNAAAAAGPAAARSNMCSLIIDALVSRSLLPESARPPQLQIATEPHQPLLPPSPWDALLNTAPLSTSLWGTLAATPASSVAQLEKGFQLVCSGEDMEQRAAAATALCGASLIRSWNVQEDAVRLALATLSPLPPVAAVSQSSQLASCAPILSAALTGIGQADALNTICLHGQVPSLARKLITILEAFGSLPRPLSASVPPSNEADAYSVFSQAFLLLVQLTETFHAPPSAPSHNSPWGPLGSRLSIPLLLTLSASFHASKPSLSPHCDQPAQPLVDTGKPPGTSSGKTADAAGWGVLNKCERVARWHALQMKGCKPPPLGSHAEKVGGQLVGLAFKDQKLGAAMPSPAPGRAPMRGGRVARGGGRSPTGRGSPGRGLSVEVASGSTGSGVPAVAAACPWELLAAVPACAQAVLTALAFGRLSSEEAAQGLCRVVDAFPAAAVGLAGHLLAECGRGSWPAATFNGVEWPSLASSLPLLEGELCSALEARGLQEAERQKAAGDAAAASMDNAPLTLPLPLALAACFCARLQAGMAEQALAVLEPALLRRAASCAWPALPAVIALLAPQARGLQRTERLLQATTLLAAADQEITARVARRAVAAAMQPRDSRLGLWSPISAVSSSLPDISIGALLLRSLPHCSNPTFLSGEVVNLLRAAAADGFDQEKQFLGSQNAPDLRGLGTAGTLACLQPSNARAMATTFKAASFGATLLHQILSGRGHLSAMEKLTL